MLAMDVVIECLHGVGYQGAQVSSQEIVSITIYVAVVSSCNCSQVTSVFSKYSLTIVTQFADYSKLFLVSLLAY